MTAGTDRDDRAATGSSTREGVLYCLKVFVSVRVALFIVAVVGVALLPGLKPVGVPGWPAHATTPGWHNLFTAWERFDGLWFLRIAEHGYANGDGSAAFYPLYPLLIRWVSFVIGGHPFAAALVVSNVSLFGALVALHALTAREFGDGIARRAILYVAVFPTSFFLFAPYSESLFLLLVVVSFWGARSGRWEVAGMAGALAALTRNPGVLLILPLAVEAFHQGSDAKRRPIRELAWAAAPVAGALAYLWYWQARAGDWLAPVHQQAGWQRQGQNPIVTLWHGTYDAYHYAGLYAGGYHQLDWLVAVPILAAAVYVAVRFRPTYGVYVWVSIIAPLSLVFDPRPLMSFPRFALPLFPAFWALAKWTEGHRLRHEILVAGSGALLGVMLLLFVNWYYVF